MLKAKPSSFKSGTFQEKKDMGPSLSLITESPRGSSSLMIVQIWIHFETYPTGCNKSECTPRKTRSRCWLGTSVMKLIRKSAQSKEKHWQGSWASNFLKPVPKQT
ncbi:unnamed protein product [Blepharisma stoltei]|uniref:Uncharacterized protein n=1 Tax=Blepharisma stoltei TaxID=1481888 RepID=A0AAU9JV16_9CILI|nr:unnamed protein product [Blepharisma stoltei]